MICKLNLNYRYSNDLLPLNDEIKLKGKEAKQASEFYRSLKNCLKLWNQILNWKDM